MRRWSEAEQLWHEVDDRGEVTSPGYGPSPLQKFWNYATSLATWTAAGFPRRSPERVAELFVICSTCEMFNGKVCTHEECGCPISMEEKYQNKLSWATESCPLDPPKWTAEL